MAEIRVSDDPAGAVAAMLDAADGHVVLAGGSSPRRAYERCSGDWSRTTVWFGDERCVGPDHEWSNYRMARGALLHRLRTAGNHRIRGELGAREAAARYDALIREHLGDTPAFDLVLLGLGPDAHVASLFPGKPALEERDRLAVEVPESGMEPHVPRISLTVPVINAARRIVFLVAGAGKAPAVARAFGGQRNPAAPASLAEDPLVVLDQAAAAELRR